MRILYIDIDTLRADHLGCYGYHRNTSPNLDALAERGVRFDNCYNSDAPCLPSRNALWSGRCGFHTGVVGHGGTAADVFIEGKDRSFRGEYEATSWMGALRRAGLYPVTVSPFAERHGAWQWYGGYREAFNPGKGGGEIADEVTPYALKWIEQNAERDNWFLHVNYWDPHTPYRTPEGFGNPFEGDSLPEWLTAEVRQRGWDGFGPHSPQEPHGFGGETFWEQYPRVPEQLDSMDAVTRWIDGYDTGIRYADAHAGRLLNALADVGVLDDTIIMVSSDHGENQGELNVWGDHQTADEVTCRVPLIVRWPGLIGEPRVDSGLHYHFDWAATLTELVGGVAPDNWDGEPFTASFEAGEEAGREYLVVSQNAWSCQRSVRFADYICLRTYHDGFKELDPVMLFNLAQDPHEQHDLAEAEPQVVDHALRLLSDWYYEMAVSSDYDVDPLMTVLREGGPFHTRGRLPDYLERLRSTGRGQHAERLASLHPGEV